MNQADKKTTRQTQSIIPRNGIVTLFGYGIKVRVDQSHLLLEDGIGADRRQARFPRVRHGLKRVVCISEDGFFTLGALKWLSDVGIPLTVLDRLGKVFSETGLAGRENLCSGDSTSTRGSYDLCFGFDARSLGALCCPCPCWPTPPASPALGESGETD